MTSNGWFAKKSRNMARKSAQSDNKLLRDWLVVQFVKNGPPLALEWTSMRSFHFARCHHANPFFPNGPPNQLLSTSKLTKHT